MSRNEPIRDVFAVVRHIDGWAVEHDGEILGVSADKDEAKATAHKGARAAAEEGKLCQVRISGEHGFAAA